MLPRNQMLLFNRYLKTVELLFQNVEINKLAERHLTSKPMLFQGYNRQIIVVEKIIITKTNIPYSLFNHMVQNE